MSTVHSPISPVAQDWLSTEAEQEFIEIYILKYIFIVGLSIQLFVDVRQIDIKS